MSPVFGLIPDAGKGGEKQAGEAQENDGDSSPNGSKSDKGKARALSPREVMDATKRQRNTQSARSRPHSYRTSAGGARDRERPVDLTGTRTPSSGMLLVGDMDPNRLLDSQLIGYDKKDPEAFSHEMDVLPTLAPGTSFGAEPSAMERPDLLFAGETTTAAAKPQNKVAKMRTAEAHPFHDPTDPTKGDSIYLEVRGSVSNVDEPGENPNTIRMWLIGFLIITIASAANSYWTFRFPSPTVTVLLAIVIAWPLGNAAEKIPERLNFHAPKWLGGFPVTLNPGYWNIKEHAVIAQMAIIGLNANISYPIYYLTVQDLPYFWADSHGLGFAFAFAFSAALIGVGFGGLARRFLVTPASMLWPANLQASLILNVLHARLSRQEEKSRFTRPEWFLVIALGAFIWYFVPAFLFTSLSFFNWPCWIAPGQCPLRRTSHKTSAHLLLSPQTRSRSTTSSASATALPCCHSRWTGRRSPSLHLHWSRRGGQQQTCLPAGRCS